MPFFPQEQVRLIINALNAKLSDIQNPNVGSFIAFVTEALNGFDQLGESDDVKKDFLIRLEYVADEDLYGAGGLIQFILDLQSHARNTVITAQDIQSAIYDSFLFNYNTRAWRKNNTFVNNFSEAEKRFKLLFVVEWVSPRKHFPDPELENNFFNSIECFLRTHRINIIALSDKEVIVPIANYAFKLLSQVLVTLNFDQEDLRKFEPSLGDPSFTKDERIRIIACWKYNLNLHLETVILPKLSETTVETAKKMGVDVFQSSLDMGNYDLLQDKTIDTILDSLAANKQVLPNGIPPNHVIAKASALYENSVFENHLREKFKDLVKDGTVYMPLNIGGHWVCLSIQKTMPKTSEDPIVLDVCYIDSMGSCNPKVLGEVYKILEKIFPRAAINSKATPTASQSDRYSCGDRTMMEIVKEISRVYVETSVEKTTIATKNPWLNKSSASDIRSVTQGLLRDVRGIPNSSSQTYVGAKRFARSWFDEHPVALAIVLLLIIAGIVTGGFGIGVLAGSAIAAHAFLAVFPIAVATLSNSALYGVILGLGGALSLFLLSKQGFSNAWEKMHAQMRAWWDKPVEPTPVSTDVQKPPENNKTATPTDASLGGAAAYTTPLSQSPGVTSTGQTSPGDGEVVAATKANNSI